jgi:hypothetical protein
MNAQRLYRSYLHRFEYLIGAVFLMLAGVGLVERGSGTVDIIGVMVIVLGAMLNSAYIHTLTIV